MPRTTTYTGRPCRSGHTERYLTDNTCAVCRRRREQTRRDAGQKKRYTPEQLQAYRQRPYVKAKLHAEGRAYRAAMTPAHKLEKKRRHRAKPNGKVAHNAGQIRYTLKRREAAAGRPRALICEACGGEGKRICFDHCHQTGRFRGWICWRCNVVLGHANDDPAILLKLVQYLAR